MKKYLILFVILLIVIVTGVIFYYQKTQDTDKPVVCTKEAKLCPDGSAVGRQGPKCEFAECPVVANSYKLDLIKQAFAKKYNKSVNEVTLTIGQETDNHVRGGVKFGAGGVGEGGYFLAAKVNDKWEIVVDGNGAISCQLVNSYKFPSNMISDCANF